MQWYPLQLLVRKWEVMIPVVLSTAISATIGVWMWITLRKVPQPIFLHYTVSTGVDSIGGVVWALFLPVMAFVFVVVNTVMIDALLLSERKRAVLLAWSTLVTTVAAGIFGALIIFANGA